MAIIQNSINANSVTPLSAVQGGTGVSSPTIHGILIAQGSSAYSPIVLTAGQVLIGTTASDPVGATLTQGAGITITSASGTITIASSSSTGGGFAWTDVTGTTQTLAAGNGYVTDNASQVTFTLPASAAIGDSYAIVGGVTGSAGWKIAQNAGQIIHYGNIPTTSGTGGSITSGNQYDTITVTCVVANTTFVVRASQGSSLSVA